MAKAWNWFFLLSTACFLRLHAQNITYNPEKGLMGQCPLMAYEDYSSYTHEQGYEVTLCFGSIILEDFLEQPISESALTNIRWNLEELYEAGTKAVVRIVYADGAEANDTSLYWVETHLQQLAPVFNENARSIAWFEAGIIGAWGEWHSSTSGLDTPENKQIVIQLLHDMLPSMPCMKLLVRTPMDIADILSQNEDDDQYSNETNSNSSSCTISQRIGFHNDCWMSSWSDYSTYVVEGLSDKDARQYWLSLLNTLTNYSPFGGETCVNHDTQEVWDQLNCSFLFHEASVLHATFLNPLWHPQVTEFIQNSGCWDDFVDNMGYRFELDNFEFPGQISPGSVVPVSFTIRNTGWSRVFSPRRAFLRLSQVIERNHQQSISMTGNAEEWEYVMDHFDDNRTDGTHAVADIEKVYVTNDEDFLYIRVKFSELHAEVIPFESGYFRLFLDMDADPSTGREEGQLGVEVMIEGSAAYDQRNGTWGTHPIYEEVTVKPFGEDKDVEIRLSLDAKYADGGEIFTHHNIALMVSVTDIAWAPQDEAPSASMGRYVYTMHEEDVIADTFVDVDHDISWWSPDAGSLDFFREIYVPDDFKSDASEGARLSLLFPDWSDWTGEDTNPRHYIKLAHSVEYGYFDTFSGENVLRDNVYVDGEGIHCFNIHSFMK